MLKTYRVFVAHAHGDDMIDTVLEGLCEAREALARELDRTSHMEANECGLIQAFRETLTAQPGQPVWFAGYAHRIEAEA